MPNAAETVPQTQPHPDVLALCLIDELYKMVETIMGAEVAQNMVANAVTRAHMCGIQPPKLRLLQ